MAGSYRIDGLAVPESLDLLHDLLAQVRADHPEIRSADLIAFETAVVEIHGNVVQHGRPPGRVSYAFVLDVAGDRLEALLTTTGDAVPDLAGLLEASLPDDPMSDSGRGMWLAEAMLDDLRYTRTADHNVWRMTRLLGDPSPSPVARPQI